MTTIRGVTPCFPGTRGDIFCVLLPYLFNSPITPVAYMGMYVHIQLSLFPFNSTYSPIMPSSYPHSQTHVAFIPVPSQTGQFPYTSSKHLIQAILFIPFILSDTISAFLVHSQYTHLHPPPVLSLVVSSSLYLIKLSFVSI